MNSTQTGATAADSVRIEGTLAIITLGGSEYKFKSGNTFPQFARANNLSVEQTDKLYPKCRELAFAAWAQKDGIVMGVRHAARYNRTDAQFDLVSTVRKNHGRCADMPLILAAIERAERRFSDSLTAMRKAAGIQG